MYYNLYIKYMYIYTLCIKSIMSISNKILLYKIILYTYIYNIYIYIYISYNKCI